MTTKTNSLTLVALSVLGLICLGGCGESGGSGDADASDTLPETLFVAQAPTGIQVISQLKADVKAGDEVVVKAVVGGRKNAFAASRAVMTVVDATLHNKCISDDDHCPMPWDYCCAPKEDLLPQTATVQITGTGTSPLRLDLTTVPQLKPLNTLIIKGTVGPRADTSTLVINATSIYVEDQKS